MNLNLNKLNFTTCPLAPECGPMQKTIGYLIERIEHMDLVIKRLKIFRDSMTLS